MQSGDPRQLLDPAPAKLRREQASEKPSHPFVGHGQQTVNRAVFARLRALRLFSTNRTFAAVDRSSMIRNHMNLPPWAAIRGGKFILPPNAEVNFAQ
jgi:hypothetical protein